MSVNASKANNRAHFPFASQMVDELRKVFGEGVRVVWASENGAEIGRRGKEVVVAVPYRTKEQILKGTKCLD